MRRFIALISTCAVGLAIVSMPSPASSETKATDEQTRVQVQPRSAGAWDDTYAVAGDISVTSGGGVNANPASLAIDANDDTVYVANSYMGRVEVIAPGQTTGSTSGTVQVRSANTGPDGEKGLFGIAVDSSDDTIYVVDRKDITKTLWAINGRTFTVDDTVTLPCDSQIHNGRAYLEIAVNSGDDTVYVPCNPESGGARGRMVALNGRNLDDSTSYDNSSTVNGGDIAFSGLAIDPTDDTVYVGGWWGPSEVQILRPAPLAYSRSMTSANLNQPQGLVLFDDTLYVSNWDNTKVAAFGLHTGGTAGFSVPLKEGADIAVESSRSLLIVPSNTQNIWLLTAPDGTLRQTIPTADFKGSSVVVSSTGLIYVGSSGSNAGQQVVKVLGPQRAAAPGVPTGTAGYEQISVSWTAPTWTGTSAIAWYQVTASPGGRTCNAQAPATTCIVGGLTSGTAYTFTVKAMNASDLWGTASAASGAVTPLAPPSPGPGPQPTPSPIPPGVPLNASASPGDERARVTWSAPTYAGSSAISVYRVTASPGGETCFVDAPATTCTVRDLTNGTPYSFRVQALNEGGWSASATTSPVTPEGPVRPRITLDPGERTANGVNDVVSTMGQTSGIPVGARLTPYVRLSRDAAYRPGVGNVVIAADGTFTWSREVRKSKPLFAYMVYEGTESNTVIWVRLTVGPRRPGG